MSTRFEYAKGIASSVPILCDLRSDTVTKPSKAMYEAMNSAEVGDDVFEEDPTVFKLERKVAEMCGHEDAIFCATGTMTNQLAMRCHLNALESIVIDHRGHIYANEAGGVAYHCQATCRPLIPEQGQNFISHKQIEASIIPRGDVHATPTKVVCLENTLHGMIMPFDEIKKIREVCDKKGVKLHLDGARLWNASVATGVSFKEYGSLFDSISLCFSKGMGAPVGSVLVGKSDFILKARHFRKVMGGGWRQAGILAAACLFAIEHNWKRMSQDHENALFVSQKLQSIGFKITKPVDTNMVWVDSSSMGFSIRQWSQAIREKGFAIIPNDGTQSRLVMHLDQTRDALEGFIKETESFVKSFQK